MLPELATLIALQQLDTAAEQARRRLAELPAAELAITTRAAAAQAAVADAERRLAEAHHERRELEKLVAAVDARLARFDSHKASVKTNQEYTALLHEIATAKEEKDGLESQVLEKMEASDALDAGVQMAKAALAVVQREGDAARADLAAERSTLEATIARLTADKQRDAVHLPAPVLARYEQLLKQRKMVAVAVMTGETCMACHVRLRPAVAQAVRRNAEFVACDSCQRLLYWVPPPVADAPPAETAKPE